MTKKHFRDLAIKFHVLKPSVILDFDNPDYALNTNLWVQWQNMVNAVADVCQDANPRFDRVKFLEACEVGLS